MEEPPKWVLVLMLGLIVCGGLFLVVVTLLIEGTLPGWILVAINATTIAWVFLELRKLL